MSEDAASAAAAAPKLTPRISRSRCFKVFKWTLFAALILLALATVASTPWCFGLTRELLLELNNTSGSMSQIYSGEEPLEVTDELVYIVVAVSVALTLLYLTIGLVAVYRESFWLSLFFGISLLACAGGSVVYYEHLLFLINMVVDAVLGLLIVLYALAVKRADRLSPESPDEFEDVAGKERKVEDDKV